MSDLIERYIHQVVHNLPPRERAEIRAELRSSIQDQLDDRFGQSPSEDEIMTVLLEMGSPHEMADSYQNEQYLVGPGLYPYLLMGLSRAWLIVPSIVIFLNIFGAVTSEESVNWVGWFGATLLAVVQATLIVSALIVLIFAVVERLMQNHEELALEMRDEQEGFDPQKLPEVDDPRAIDRFESIFGVIFGLIAILVMFYFLSVGGLTLRFDLNDTGDVIPVPTFWLTLLIADVGAMILLNLLILRRNRWDILSWLIQTILELVGVFCLYFVLYLPVVNQIALTNPSLELPVESIAQAIAVLSALPNIIGRGSRLIRLWNDSNRYASAYPGEAAM